MKTPRFLAAVTLAIAILGSVVQSQDSGVDTSFLDREVGRRRSFVVGSPVITWMSVQGLFEDLQLPVGFEWVAAFDRSPAPWEEHDSTPTALIVTNGLTLRQLLDALVDADPRYEWRLVDGVVVVRPVAAWADADHPLHRAVPSVVLNTVTFAGAVDGILKATGQYTRPYADKTEDTRFSLQFPGGSLLELLSGIVRAHGTFSWNLTSTRMPDGPGRLVRGPQLSLRGSNRLTRKPEGTYVQSVGAVISKALLPGPVVTDPVSVLGQAPAYTRPAGTYVAGTGAITGHARDRSGAVLPGVKVTITRPGDQPLTAVTDSHGNFDIRARFDAAAYTVQLYLPGFATITRTVEAVPLGVVSVTADMRVCDTTLEDIRVDMGLPASIQAASAVVHFKIASIDEPRPAKETGEGFCGGREIEVHGTSAAVAKLEPGLAEPRGFLVRSGRTGYQAGEELLAFLEWNPALQQYVPGGYMVPVVDGRIVWPSGNNPELRNGLPVNQAITAVRRLARR